MKIQSSSTVLVIVLLTVAWGFDETTRSTSAPPGGGLCKNIEKSLTTPGSLNTACRCFETVRDSEDATDVEDVRNSSTKTAGPWLACTRERMPVLYKWLNSLPNGTLFDKLWIWDSLIPVVPVKFFGRINVRKLILENDHVGEFADGVLSPLAEHLRHVIIKNNIVRELNERLFEGLREIRHLDLSMNRITGLNRTSLGRNMNKLRSLSLYGNRLVAIATGAFESLTDLRKLNLASNSLTHLDDGVFRNLHKLEFLTLENNRLNRVSFGVFDDLHNLKVLNLGANLLSALRMPAVFGDHLTQLYLHNNIFFSIADANLQIDAQNLANLRTLHLDNNHLVGIENDQFVKMPNLQVLSIASNELSSLQPNCFRNLHNLSVLSLQNNQLDEAPFRQRSLFGNVPNLQKLYLSQNRMTSFSAMNELKNLRVLSLAHNRINFVEIGSFLDLVSLERLYVNDNNLSNLHNSTLAELSALPLKAIDFSDNPWHCDCHLLLSLANFLHDHSELVIDADRTLCSDDNGQSLVNAYLTLGQSCPQWRQHVLTKSLGRGAFERLLSNDVDTAGMSTSFWITVLGSVLGTVSVLILIGIGLLYLQDGRWARFNEGRANLLKRVPSDMVNLIPKCSSISVDKV